MFAVSALGATRPSGEPTAARPQAASGAQAIRTPKPSDAEDVVARTGSGGLDLRGVNGALRADSGSGGIKVEGTQAGPWELDSGSGSIRISLPGDAAFELDAASSSGDIDVDHPVTVQGKFSEDRIKGQVRGGGAMLHVRSGSGDIRIR